MECEECSAFDEDLVVLGIWICLFSDTALGGCSEAFYSFIYGGGAASAIARAVREGCVGGMLHISKY